jgi:DUF4097 and DUF4098 domain-containing protein YvlB
MDKKYLNTVFYVIFILLLSGQLFATTITDTFEKTLPFKEGSLLSVSNENGNVEIEVWNKNEIEIIAHKKVRASDSDLAEKMMENLQIEIEENRGTLEVKTRYPKNSGDKGGLFGWIFGKNSNNCSVEYKIRIPEKADLNIETTNGNVEVKEVSGRIRMETTNGEVLAKEINGLVRCKTTNGSIKVDFEKIPIEDDMFFKTTNGSIRLYLPENYGGYVDLKTTNGKVESDFHVKDVNYKKRTHLKGQINSGESEITCSTTNGSIYLYSTN